MGGSEREFVQSAFETNWIAPLGPNVTGFEEDLESYLGNDVKIAGLSSGTAAIHLALILLNVGLEDEVICQSMTFSASANPILYRGATPVFVDSEPQTWNISPDYLEKAIEDRIAKGKKPKAIIAVHLYGMPFNVDRVMEIASRYDIPLIEDSAEALGSKYKARNCGTFGHIGILSFNGNKIITTSGGGALVAQTEELKNKAIFLATQARENAPHYEHREVGYNYRLSNVCAGIGRGQMQVLDDHIKARRANHHYYKEIFETMPGVEVLSEPSEDYYSNHWLSCITIDSQLADFDREELRLALEQENIESRPLWKPMHLQPVFKNPIYYGSDVSENLFRNGLCLPSGSNLNDDDRARIKKVISLFG